MEKPKSELTINFDRASKFYEQGEKVTGTMELKELKFSDFSSFKVTAESYQDTVSQIRGSMGRPPLDVEKRTYFMKKDVSSSDVPNTKQQKTFEFILESTEPGEKLLDVYVGVEFSIIVSIIELELSNKL